MNATIRRILFGSLGLLALSNSNAAPETYTLDPNHSYVQWNIKHFDFSTQTGKWWAEGTLILDKDNPEKSSVEASVKITGMVTGIDELNKHLQSALFFDAKKFPVASFKSDKVEMTGKDTAKVHGLMTIHGVTKPVTLDVTFNKADINPISNKMTAGFTATTTLKRSDFGVSGLLPGVGDEVNLEINAEASKNN
ncbi:YceI family protein [Legionella waltersii]|uniref:Polyprenyl-pyrophosphate binding protein n=1 Tax=Legionella waltersii TaxID=66969 RepID=A0A0W1ABU9_9GAMM|nr:YceI family protein [Legionella waltersii]KTD78826.1 polyprenyl-pyrophosphate binding protein [Legionella waltersii]SNV10944.1 polyprenyl-pyrophosphate binding protein [Legionella waltersii]